MIAQNVMLGLLAKAPITSTDFKIDTVSDTKPSNSFNDTFEKESQKAYLKDNSARKINPDDTRRKDLDNKTPESVNTYREALRKNAKLHTNDTTTGKKEIKSDVKNDVKDDDKGKIKKENNQKVSQEEAIIAQVLGMDPKALASMMKDLGINLKDLEEPGKIEGIVQKLSEKLGLNTEQTKSLQELLTVVSSKLQEMKAPIDQTENVKEIQTAPEQNKRESVENSTNDNAKPVEAEPKLNKEDLIAKLKDKIQEFTDKLQKNPDTLKKELSQIVNNMLAKQANREVIDKAPSDTKVDEEAIKSDAVNKPLENAQEGSKPQEEKNSGKENSENSNEVKKDAEQNQEAAAKTDDNIKETVYLKSSKGDIKTELKSSDDIVAPINNIEPDTQKATGSIDPIKVQKEAPISKRDILTQVIDKAKVAISEDKSEMVLSMKPESLGKLSLKVVTEHGIVTAKFIAESQQVKAVLESNMQLLKDTLEKQGLSVQGFSVSVDQNPSKEFSGNNDSYQGNKGDNSGVKSKGLNSIITKDAVSKVDNISPYSLGEHRINLTA
ncbi:MAG: flagellar hook-length control protein FliK [Bacillota bacterium]|nr:flagellar hook-length control protein FliK [Bacillota bacterium]